jgi:hypothetical protein
VATRLCPASFAASATGTPGKVRAGRALLRLPGLPIFTETDLWENQFQ